MLRIKVCGMNHPENIREIAALEPEFLGLIFYSGSPRNALRLHTSALREIGPATRLTGVFVNETPYNIRKTAARYNITTLQLHGQESPAACEALEQDGFTVIKAFPVGSLQDLEAIRPYEDCCSYALLDTRSDIPGGSGQTFDWSLLEAYDVSLPFFLGGGIGPGSISALKEIHHPRLYAVDLNSRFETSPGIKSPELLSTFIRGLRNQ